MQKTTTSETIPHLLSLHQCKALWVVWRTHQTRNIGVEERKAGMGGSIPSNCSSVPLLHFLPYFLLQAVNSCSFAHITQYNNDYTSSPAMLNQQEKVVFHFTGGSVGGMTRGWGPKRVKFVPLNKAEFSGGELNSQGVLMTHLQL